MSDQSDFIVQIQKKENDVAQSLKKDEQSNNQRVILSKENSSQVITGAEDAVKEKGQVRFQEAKAKAKDEYKKILVEEDNRRRDVVEGGKINLPKASKHVQDTFVALFQ